MTNDELNKIIFKNKNTINIVKPKENLFNLNTAKGRPLSKYNARMKHLTKYDEIKEDLYLIPDLKYDYITTTGNVYVYYGNGNFFYKKRIFSKQKKNKYIYVNVVIDEVNKQRRLHVLLARTFIPNEYEKKFLKYVGHKNDHKWDYHLENLYWTNNKENTKDAALKGFNDQPKAEDNKNSIKIKVLDKNTKEIVGVYGSIREAERCIENVSMAFISRMCSREMYKPRNKNYIYQKATEEEFEKNISLKSKKLTESIPMDKSPKVFYLCNNQLNYRKKFDNQIQASKICGISQANISHMIKNNITINGWYCEYEKSINYKEGSGYRTLIGNKPMIIIENIYTKERLTFASQVELKKFLGLEGHNTFNYLSTCHLLMDQWEIVELQDKIKNIAA